jgi:hypothetical protein
MLTAVYLFGLFVSLLVALVCRMIGMPGSTPLFLLMLVTVFSAYYVHYLDSKVMNLEGELENARRAELARIRKCLRAARNPMLVAIDEAEFSA